MLEYHLEVQYPWLNAIDQCEHIDVETGLHRRKLIQLIKNLLWVRVLLQLDYDARADSIRRLVTNIANTNHLLLAMQLCDFFNQSPANHLIWELSNNNCLAIFFTLHNLGYSAHRNAAAPSTICGSNTTVIKNQTTSREIWAFYKLHQILNISLRTIDQMYCSINNLA